MNHPQLKTLKIDTQTSSVQIVLNGREVHILAIYKPSQATLTTENLDLLTKSADWQTSMGDFKSKHFFYIPYHIYISYNHTTYVASKTLFDLVQQSDCYTSPLSTLTYFLTSQYYRPNVIEITLGCVLFFTQIHSLNKLFSNHQPILLEVSNMPFSLFPSPTSNQLINLKKYTKIFFNSPVISNLKTNNKFSIDT